MDGKEKLIQFQKCNFNYIYFIFFLVSIIISTLIEENIGEEQQDKEKKIIYDAAENLLILYISGISDFLAIIPFFLKKYRSKGKTEIDMKSIKLKQNASTTGSLYIYNDLYESELDKKYRQMHIYSILVAGFDFLSELPVLFYYMYNLVELEFYAYYLNSSVVFNIILQYIMSFFILKIQFYRHHYFSFILNAISFIILMTMDIINSVVYNAFELNFIFAYIFHLLFLSLEYAFGKKALENGFLSIYSLLIRKAIFNAILVIILSILLIIIKIELFPELLTILNESNSILLCLAYFFFIFIANVFKWYVIDRFSPSHLPIAFLIEDFSYFIAFLIQKSEQMKSANIADLTTRIIIFIILFLGVLMHNEIVIINLCGLNQSTKLYLDKKVIEEDLLSNSENNDILKRFDTTICEMEEKFNEDDNENDNDNNNKNEDKEDDKNEDKEDNKNELE